MRKLSLLILSVLFTPGTNADEFITGWVTDFNSDWKFQPGEVQRFMAPGFDDRSWRVLELPHDWSIEGDFNESNPDATSGGNESLLKR